MFCKLVRGKSNDDAKNGQKQDRQRLPKKRVPLIVRVNSLSPKDPKSLLSFFVDPKFSVYQNPCQAHTDDEKGHLSPQIMLVPQFSHTDVIKDFFKANLSNSRGKGQPPKEFDGYRVFLGARIVEHKIGRRFGLRHIFINMYEGPDNYAMIESLPWYSDIGWVSGIWVRENIWETRGLTWELIPTDYESFIRFAKEATRAYHNARLPYNYKKGPNSNSYVWWLLIQWGLDISDLFSGLTYWGTDYWRYYPIRNYANL